jgi:hypothetical protein
MQNERSENNPANNEDAVNPDGELTTHDIVRKHLEDKNHVITEEEFKKVKVGHGLSEDAVTTGAESEAYFSNEKDLENGDKNEEKNDNKDRPIMPWDVVE